MKFIQKKFKQFLNNFIPATFLCAPITNGVSKSARNVCERSS